MNRGFILAGSFVIMLALGACDHSPTEPQPSKTVRLQQGDLTFVLTSDPDSIHVRVYRGGNLEAVTGSDHQGNGWMTQYRYDHLPMHLTTRHGGPTGVMPSAPALSLSSDCSGCRVAVHDLFLYGAAMVGSGLVMAGTCAAAGAQLGIDVPNTALCAGTVVLYATSYGAFVYALDDYKRCHERCQEGPKQMVPDDVFNRSRGYSDGLPA